ncbi:serine/threonine-protein kinase gad8 [Trichoderma asperellum]|uniref:Serine/threonine-protein kinase gad8 n=1 Tax=Trichoderma asperellum TaxID=101201 RepID=A0A6V8R0X8_TRIAP|nr:serine/threonine-protein kinase gad8 [Trichoderma asperellum]
MAETEHSCRIDVPQPEETFPSPSRPGILTIILREGIGLSVPGSYKEHPDKKENRRNMPYAILDYDKSQKLAFSFKGTTQNPVWVSDTGPMPYGPLQYDEETLDFRESNWNFDVCRPAELAIYLYLRDSHTSSFRRNQDTFLGVARMEIDPSRASEISSQWLNVQHGTGQLRISLEYKGMKDQELGEADFEMRHVDQLVKKDTRQRYITRTIPVLRRPQNVNHSFIAPLSLTFQSQEGLNLLSPVINGGHLFHHLQRQQRFNLESAQFYAAEILCALEYLHDARGIYSWLKPRNVLLDSIEHVVLCGPGLFNPGIDGDRSSYGMPEYPSPEVLLNQGKPRAADWWTLGIFLYEMLTGLPLFFDKNTDEIRRKILGPEPFQISEVLPPTARDTITRLLEREPSHRLGAKGGASKVKEHPFFAGIDWVILLQRNYAPPFKPEFCLGNSDFPQHGVQEHAQLALQDRKEDTQLFSIEMLLKDPEPESNLSFESDDVAALTPESSQEKFVQEADNKSDDGWELVWKEDAPREIYFFHRATGNKKSIPARAMVSSKKKNGNDDDDDDDDDDAARSGGPSTSQKQDALEAALQAGHDHIVLQIISFTSPLEWSVDRKKLYLVRLMLNNGADVSFPGYGLQEGDQSGPVLVRAVATGDRKLVELLLQSSPDWVDLTRALGLAVDRRDGAMAQLLLANGARCDFQDEDRPLPHAPGSGCCFEDISQPEAFMPPLVRAVHRGDVSLVRLLLRNGANANAGYHDFHADLGVKYIKFSLLLAAGADISLAQPVWRVQGSGDISKENTRND